MLRKKKIKKKKGGKIIIKTKIKNNNHIERDSALYICLALMQIIALFLKFKCVIT